MRTDLEILQTQFGTHKWCYGKVLGKTPNKSLLNYKNFMAVSRVLLLTHFCSRYTLSLPSENIF